MSNSSPWVQMFGGGAFELRSSRMDMSQCTVQDLSWSLAGIGRYNSHTTKHYSVAEHCCILADYLGRTTGEPAMALGGLLHDAHEAITGDMTSPMQNILESACPGFKKVFRGLQAQIDAWLLLHLELDGLVNLGDPRIHQVDLRIIADEQVQAMEPSPRPVGDGWPVVEPLGVTLRFLTREQAAREWRERLMFLRNTVLHGGR